METVDPIALISDAIAQRNWPLLAVLVLVVIVPLVLAALGRKVPILTPILDGAVALAIKLFPKKAAPAVAPSEEVAPKEPEGISSVVDVHEEKTK